MFNKAKKSPLRRIRVLLNAIIIVLLTLLGRYFHDDWKDQKAGQEVIDLCQLPELPEQLTVLHARAKESHVILSVSAEREESEIFDAWMAEVDQWKKKPPFGVLNFSFRESEAILRMDFTAQLRLAPREKY